MHSRTYLALLLTGAALACAPEGDERVAATGAPLTGDQNCAHPLCSEGGPVDAQCHPCAATVCAQDPFCCSSGWDALCTAHVATMCNESCDAPSACDHEICQEGGPLDASCDSCAASICAQDPFCCSSGWDSICVAEVQSICGQSCNAPECAHPLCETGEALDPACDSCAGSICAQDPFCCNGQWDRLCTQQVETVCGGSCEAPAPECDHAPCDSGDALDPACDNCVADVCAQDPFCCNVSWDQLCVSTYDSTCGTPTPAKADILFVIDDSCSMTEEQQALAANFRTLLDHVQNENIDFQIGVTTTDVSPTGAQGALIGPIISSSSADPESEFAAQVMMGTNGSPFEQGLEASRLALSQNINAGFVRADAGLVVIYLSDEDDQSPDAVTDYVSFVQGLKNGLPATLNTIVGAAPGGCTGPSGSAGAGLRYLDASAATGGANSSICSADWSAALTNVPPAPPVGACSP